MRHLIAFVLILAACKGGERTRRPVTRTAAPAPAPVLGSDALMLRVPRAGGVARVSAYPDVDSTVWTATDAAPPFERVLAFDADAGLIAAADSRGLPLWLDLRVGTVTLPAHSKLRDVESVDGSTIYGVGTDGAVARYTPAGNWLYKPVVAARAVFPQSGGTVLILGGRGASARLWRMRPPGNKVLDSVTVANAVRGIGAPLGDQIYLVAPNHTLTGVRARTMQVGNPIAFDHGIVSVATTPSGDRFYVIEDSVNAVQVVDRYQDRITARIDLPARPRDLRVDPFGRYVLVRAAAGDSAWVIAVGTDQVVGTIRSQWRADLPFVAPDGAIATSQGEDLVFLDGRTLHERSRVAGGTSDFWYPFVWNGLRARAAALDQPARFPTDTDSTRAATSPVRSDTAPVSTTAPAAAPVDSSKLGFTVSFAVLLNEGRARDQASKISVNGQAARVVTGVSSGVAVYRVVLGPYRTREEADRVGHASGQSYVVYAGSP